MTSQQIKTDFSLEENLKNCLGQYVQIMLSSGDSISGHVKSVNQGLVHLEKLHDTRWRENRSNFDALVKLSDIIALQIQARGFEGNIK